MERKSRHERDVSVERFDSVPLPIIEGLGSRRDLVPGNVLNIE